MSSTNPFTTTRSQRWLSTDLGEIHAATIHNVEKFGCHILQVKGTSTTPGWSYSIGLYDTARQPEIIAVGMPQALAVSSINKAANLLREGVNLTTGRHANLITSREAEFRPADPKWVDRLMGRALWYYEDELPPTLQLIYPDLNNRFQYEADFDERFRQPLLQRDAPQTSKEEALWNHP